MQCCCDGQLHRGGGPASTADRCKTFARNAGKLIGEEVQVGDRAADGSPLRQMSATTLTPMALPTCGGQLERREAGSAKARLAFFSGEVCSVGSASGFIGWRCRGGEDQSPQGPMGGGAVAAGGGGMAARWRLLPRWRRHRVMCSTVLNFTRLLTSCAFCTNCGGTGPSAGGWGTSIASNCAVVFLKDAGSRKNAAVCK